MNAYTDQDEVERLKAWWKEYGAALVIGVVLGLALLFGYRYWNEWREEKLATASDIYAELLERGTGKEGEAMVDRLKSDYAGTPYAGLAALLAAKRAHDSGDINAAMDQLKWASDNADDPTVARVARFRLARLRADRGEAEAALALLSETPAPGFEGAHYELKGDLFAAKGDVPAARDAYESALKHVSDDNYRRILTMKRDDLSGKKP